MLPALGRTTASAKAVATAASIALPPSRSTATPASVARGWSVTTIARSPAAAGVSSGNGQPSGTRGRVEAIVCAGADVGALSLTAPLVHAEIVDATNTAAIRLTMWLF